LFRSFPRSNHEDAAGFADAEFENAGFLLCGKEWIDGEALEVRSPWDQGLVGRVTMATRADARQAVNHAVACVRRTRAFCRDGNGAKFWKTWPRR
jgi:delta 1-pyrroline-5-carboxylate dehydrogenase